MEKIKVAIVGYGNIGQYALQAVQAAEDMELVGVIRHSAQAQQPKELEGICVVDSVEKLPGKAAGCFAVSADPFSRRKCQGISGKRHQYRGQL